MLFALAGAISTVPVSITIMILLSPDPRRGALPFLIGSVAGSIVVVGLSAVGLQLLPGRPRLRQDELLAQIGLVVGVLLIGYAVYLFWHRSQTDSAVVGKLKTRFQSARPWEFVVLGPGPESASQGDPARRRGRGRDQRPGTALVPRSLAGPRLRRCHPVSSRRAHRRLAALPGAGRSAADGRSTRGCSGTDRRLRRSQP